MATSVYLGGGGGGTPASPTTSIQFNNAGAFGGSANLEWDGTAEWNKLIGFIGPSQLLVSDPNNIPGSTGAGLTVDVFNTTGNSQSAIKYNSIGNPAGDGLTVAGYNGGVASANNNTTNYGFIFNINASAYHQGSGSVSKLQGAFIDVEAFPGTNTLPGTVTTMQGIEIFTFIDPTETVATAVALQIDDVTGAATNYALTTGAGLVKLGGLPSTDPASTNVLWKAGTVVAFGNHSGEVDVIAQSGAAGNTPGSPLVLTAGDGAGSGLGGSVLITSGGSGSGTPGDIVLTSTDFIKMSGPVLFPGNGSIATGQTNGNNLVMRAWDTGGATYRNLLTLTSSAAPSLNIVPVAPGTVLLQASDFKSSDGSSGINTTITTGSLVGKTITVKNGLITSFA